MATSESPALPSFRQLSGLRSTAYRFLACLFLYPEDDRLQRLRAAAQEILTDPEDYAGFAFFAPWLRLAQTVGRLDARRAERVREDYVRLFHVNPQAPPYESFYVDPEGRQRGRIAAQLAREYHEAGLKVGSALRQPPDFLAVELEFMSFLCNGESAEPGNAQREDLLASLGRQRDFLDRHLLQWFPPLANRLRGAAPGRLYEAAAAATGAFLIHDADLIRVVARETHRHG